jgi:uncharacterized repeat protein (TIGR03803 family)
VPHRLPGRFVCFPIVAAFVFAFSTLASGQVETVLHRFNGSDGQVPQSALIPDKLGNLYGTTVQGGAFGWGTVYELVPPAAPGARWTETTLYSFTGGNDGAAPGALVFDKAGNLYGTTGDGGVNATETLAGGVFKLSPPTTSGAPWTKTVLYSFPGSSTDAGNPAGPLVFDIAGNLYGATSGGGTESGLTCGSSGCGTVYQLKPPSISGGPWTETVLYNFLSSVTTDGFGPSTGVIVGPSGVLYGTTPAGGAAGLGTFFKLTPPLHPGGSWGETIPYNFQGNGDGSLPNGLTKGKNGALLGTTGLGGASNKGTVFELSPISGGQWSETILYSFLGGQDGSSPLSGVTLDLAGNLYGTTAWGGDLNCAAGNPGCGTVYKLNPPAASGGTWTKTTLHAFSGTPDGAEPFSGVLLKRGGLFGVTAQGGIANGKGGYGVVFRIVP